MAQTILRGTQAALYDLLNTYSRNTMGRSLSLPDRPLLDKRFLWNCADAYDHATHTPNDPSTRRAYDALIAEVLAQFARLQRVLRFALAPFRGDPYRTAAAMRYDVVKHQRLLIRRSDQDALPSDHPLATPGLCAGWVMNDHFRGVHDVFHLIAQRGFDPLGEEIVAQLQAAVCSPTALPALITETRLQNAWVYVRRHRPCPGRGDKPVVFPTQKAFAAPAEMLSYDAWRHHRRRQQEVAASTTPNTEQGGIA